MSLINKAFSVPQEVESKIVDPIFSGSYVRSKSSLYDRSNQNPYQPKIKRCLPPSEQ